MTTSKQMKRDARKPLQTYWVHERGASYGFWKAQSGREAIALMRAEFKHQPGAFMCEPTWSRVKATSVAG